VGEAIDGGGEKKGEKGAAVKSNKEEKTGGQTLQIFKGNIETRCLYTTQFWDPNKESSKKRVIQKKEKNIK